MPTDLTAVYTKSVVVTAIRAFLDKTGFQEVITPVFSRGVPVEPTLYPFTTTWSHSDGDEELYLAMSPENGLKKMLGMGLGNCYAIGKTFRNLENTGSHHRPEFLMLEWYRWDATFEQIMDDVVELVRAVNVAADLSQHRAVSHQLTYQGQTFDLDQPWPRISIDTLCQNQFGVGLEELTDEATLFGLAAQKSYQTDGATWEQLFNQLFLNELEPLIPAEPCFLVDFPARTSPLCRPRLDKPYLAERFEVFINRLELGNGNTEQTDATLVKKQFELVQHERQQAEVNVPTLDTDFIDALHQLQQTGRTLAGIGLGVERLAMIMADVTDIAAVDPLAVSSQRVTK